MCFLHLLLQPLRFLLLFSQFLSLIVVCVIVLHTRGSRRVAPPAHKPPLQQAALHQAPRQLYSRQRIYLDRFERGVSASNEGIGSASQSRVHRAILSRPAILVFSASSIPCTAAISSLPVLLRSACDTAE